MKRFALLAALLFTPLAHGQALTPVPAVKPIEVQLQRTRPVHLSLKIDGTDAQVVSPGLFVIREASTAGVVNLTVMGHHWGTYILTVTTTKDGRLANAQYSVHVGTVLRAEKVP